MKKYFVFLCFFFVCAIKSIGANSIAITNTATQYTYGSAFNLELTFILIPDEFGVKKPAKVKVQATVPNNVTWNPVQSNVFFSPSTGLVASNISFQNHIIEFDLTNLYNGQNPQSTTFGLSVKGLSVVVPSQPVCTDAQSQITAQMLFYDSDGLVIVPTTTTLTGSYSFQINKTSTVLDIQYYRSNDAAYAAGNDVYFVDLYTYVSSSYNYTAINYSFQSNQNIINVVRMNNYYGFPTTIQTDNNTTDNLYTFQAPYSGQDFFRVYIKNVTSTAGVVSLTLNASMTLVNSAYCLQPTFSKPFSANFGLSPNPDSYSYPRTENNTQSSISTCSGGNTTFQIDNLYNGQPNSTSYVEIINRKELEITGLTFTSSASISNISIVTCSGTTKSITVQDAITFSASDKANINKIVLSYTGGIAANSFIQGIISYAYNAAKLCGDGNFVFNVRKTSGDAIVSTKSVPVSITGNPIAPSNTIRTKPAFYDITPDQSYIYTVEYYPSTDVKESWTLHFPINEHLTYDDTQQPLFSINGEPFATLSAINAAHNTHLKYQPLANEFVLSGVNLVPVLTNCSYSQPYVSVQIPVKVKSKPIGGDLTGYIKLYNESNVSVPFSNYYGYDYQTSFADTPKINGITEISCDGGILSDSKITIKTDDPFSAIGSLENGSGKVYSNIPVTFTVNLPKDGVDYSSIAAKIYDQNNIEKLTIAAPSTVTYIAGDNSESGQVSASSKKVRLVFNNISISGYEKMKLFLGFPAGKGYTNGQIDFNFSVGGSAVTSNNAQITVGPKSDCDVADCADCITSFSPIPGQQYIVSAWVKESFTGSKPAAYVHSGIKINFNNSTITDAVPLMRPSGPVVDGWQRIEASFTVPATAKNIQILLVNDGSASDVFFDDIRIHPYNSNMKSFVYDPSTQKLVAELDENNFATLYEYDDEGILIRVKKETERGVMTIKETRSNQSKVQTNTILKQ